MLRYAKYLLLLGIIFSTMAIFVVNRNTAQTDMDGVPYDDCRELEHLLDTNTMPYDYSTGGGELAFEGNLAQVSRVLTADLWADYFYWRVGEGGGTLTVTPTMNELDIEIGVSLGVSLIKPGTSTDEDALPRVTFVAAGSTDDLTFDLEYPGVYTLIVRRPHVTHEENIGEYALDVRFDGTVDNLADNPVKPYLIENNVRSTDVNLIGGRQFIRFNSGAEAYIPPESAELFTDNSAQSRISLYTVPTLENATELSTVIVDLLGEATTSVNYTGGGLGARWQGAEGPLLLYVETMDYTRDNISALLTSGLDRLLSTSYSQLASVYLLDDCVGFELRATGGRGVTFLAPVDSDAEFPNLRVNANNASEILDNNSCEDFAIRLNAPASVITVGEDGEVIDTADYQFCISWEGIEPASEVRLEQGVFTADLIGERSITLQTTRITEFRRNTDTTAIYGLLYELPNVQPDTSQLLPYQLQNNADGSINDPLQITVRDEDDEEVHIVLDWFNLAAFRYGAADVVAEEDDRPLCALNTEDVDDEGDEGPPASICMMFEFTENEAIRRKLVRSGAGLERVTALDEVIHIIYRGDNGTDGEEHLILPDNETFIELVTPAEENPFFIGDNADNAQEFDATALPGQSGFAPRHSNNLGHECHAYPDLHPEANCAPNGYPNPANGNLWYGIADHSADGYLIDLALLRSYNSRAAGSDGPFGFGWTSNFLLDYNVEFDTVRGARTVTSAEVGAYRVGLDLIWTPRGMITYTTPTGSRHIFVREQGSVDFFRSVDLPGWVLFRPNLRSRWQLLQSNGQEIFFDRAGRIIGYGYPDEARLITIQYIARFEDRVDGPGGFGESNAVWISDNFNERRLELYYNADHHIYRSVLRDLLERPDVRLACELADNCYETLYRYDAQGRLLQVIYPNRQTARYFYEAVDAGNRLICHHDPRAPIAPNMAYEYRGTNPDQIRMVVLEADTPCSDDILFEPHWYKAEYDYNDDSVITTVTDNLGNRVEYTYTIDGSSSEDTWRDRNVGYLLTSIYHDAEAELGHEYRWIPSNGYPVINNIVDTESGRNILYVYEANPPGLLDEVVLSRITDSEGQQVTRYQTGRLFDTQRDPLYTAPFDLFVGGSNSADNQIFLQYDYSPQSTNYIYVSEVYRAGQLSQRITRSQDGSKLNWISQVVDFDNRAVVFYDYNAVGLVSLIRKQDLSGTGFYLVRYFYDGLGQIFAIADSERGTYFINNEVIPCDSDEVCREVTVTDPMNGVTIYRYDGREQLIEVILQEGEEDNARIHLRRRYQYDDFKRLTGELQYAVDANDVCEFEDSGTESNDLGAADADVGNETVSPQNLRCLITTYQYGVENNREHIITTDPAGRVTSVTYDSFGRVTQNTDFVGNTTEYVYDSTTDVTQMTHLGERTLQTNYTFDAQQRLVNLEYQPNTAFPLNWRFTYSDQNHPLSMTLSDQLRVDWDWRVIDSRLQGVTFNNFDWNDNDIESQAPNRFLTYLGNGDLHQLISQGDTSFTNIQVTRCPDENGAYRLIYHRRAGSGSLAVACDLLTEGVDAIYQYDVYDRLIAITDEFGSRTFTYEVDTVQEFRWRVTMRTSTGDTQFTWVMLYNIAGDLVQWTDDSGITRSYEYDLLGRMISVSTGDETDAAYINYSYDALGQVTQVQDGLGNRMHYFYDNLSRLSCILSETTGVYTVYTYNDFGQVASIERYHRNGAKDCTSGEPIGNVVYEYEHCDNPLLLTGYGSGENLHTFQWGYNNIRQNTLRYIAPQARFLNVREDCTLEADSPFTAEYNFNALGQLQKATDALGNVYTWDYNGYGYLSRFTPPDTLTLDDSTLSSRFYTLDYTPTFESNNIIRFQLIRNNRVQWRFAFERTPLGLLETFTNLGRVQFEYDDLARLSHIFTQDQSNAVDYEWSITRADGQDVVTIDLNDVQYTLTFDPLDRVRTIVTDQEIVDFRFITPFGRAERIEVLHYDNSPDGNNRTLTKTGEYIFATNAVTFLTIGATHVYTVNPSEQLLNYKLIRCAAIDNQLGCDASIGDETIVTFGGANNVQSVEYDDGSREAFTYNDAGKVITYMRQDAAGGQMLIEYEYDELWRVNAVTATDASGNINRVLYMYDGLDISAVCYTTDLATHSCTDEVIIERYGYDALGNIATRQFTTYSFNINEGETVPDAFRRFIIPNSFSTTTFDATYTPFGQLETFGNGASMTYSDDGLGLPTMYDTGTEGATYEFTYISNPRYDLNNLMLLDEIASDDLRYHYTYNEFGNLDTFTVESGVASHEFTYSYNPDGITIHNEVDGLVYDRPYHTIVPASTLVPSNSYTVTTQFDVTNLRLNEMRNFGNGISFNVDYHYAEEDAELHSGMPLLAQTISIDGINQEGLPLVNASNTSEGIAFNVHRYFYSYDDAGNLSKIVYVGPLNAPEDSSNDRTRSVVLQAKTCATFSYDGANRLVSAQIENESPTTYTYDALDRLVRADGRIFIYIDDAEVPAFVYDDNGIGSKTDANVAPDGWTFDDAGRLVAIVNSTPETDNPCRLGLSRDIPDFRIGDTFFNGMIVDPATEIAFGNGRAYLPAIGRYLQRNLAAPNPTNAVYDYRPQAISVPMPQPRLTIGDGLYILNEAMQRTPEQQVITAHEVNAANLPRLSLQYNELAASFIGHSRASDTMMQMYLELPAWLQEAYNQPNLSYDFVSGQIIWDANLWGGQFQTDYTSYLNFNTDFWRSQLSLNSPMLNTPDELLRFETMRHVGFRHSSNPIPSVWYPRGDQFLSNIALPIFRLGTTPNRITNILVLPWLHPEQNIHILNVMQQLLQQDNISGIESVGTILRDNTPRIRRLPFAIPYHQPLDSILDIGIYRP